MNTTTRLSGVVRTRATVAEGILADTQWQGGFRMVDYQPGNGTRYVIAFQRVPNNDETSAIQQRAGLPENAVIVSWLFEHKCMPLSLDADFLHWSYVQEKLRCSTPTAVVLAELFAFVLPERIAMTSEQWTQSQEKRQG